MNHRIKTSVYYLSQLLIIVAAIATGSPARADERVFVARPAVVEIQHRPADRNGLPSPVRSGIL
jgi:hypothetical protein